MGSSTPSKVERTKQNKRDANTQTHMVTDKNDENAVLFSQTYRVKKKKQFTEIAVEYFVFNLSQLD